MIAVRGTALADERTGRSIGMERDDVQRSKPQGSRCFCVAHPIPLGRSARLRRSLGVKEYNNNNNNNNNNTESRLRQ
ncbi:hypothetical protein PG989_005667 [Apiospora arundinis]